MCSTEAKKDESRREIMRAIEHKHLGRCMDQLWGEGRRTLVELMELKDSHHSVVVVKQFENRVPTSSSSKPWPELSGVWVYVPIDDADNTWEGLDRALQSQRDKLNGS